MRAQRYLRKQGRGRGNFNSTRLLHPVLSWQLPPEQWPECDRKAWEAACLPGGPLDKDGPAAHLVKETRNIREAAFGRLISFLTAVGALDREEPTVTRLNAGLLTSYIETMRMTMSAHTLRNSLHNLYLILRAMVPGHDFKWIIHHPDYPREREVIASKKDVRPPNPFAVLDCAFKQADDAASSGRNFKAAIKYRNAVMMMVLMTHVIRLKNLAEMRVGEHLIFYPDHIRLVFEESVKNREIIDTVLTDRIEGYMRAYFDNQRPLLLRDGDDHGAVWVNLDGHPLKYSTMGQLIVKITQAWGHPMTPHGARYALATTIMRKDPRRIGVASAALAHRGTSSVNRVYDQSGSAAAQSYWQGLLADRIKR